MHTHNKHPQIDTFHIPRLKRLYFQRLSNALCPKQKNQVKHTYKRMKEKRGNCAVCYWSQKRDGVATKNIVRTRSYFGCDRCGKCMCKSCFDSFK
ncbi:hypothetical protein AKO1_002503, partial [Acrasis kona]